MLRRWRTHNRRLWLVAPVVLLLATTSYALNYLWLTHYEMTTFGDIIRFWPSDSLCGVIRSNSEIGFLGTPLCCLTIIVASDYGPEPNPDCPENVITNALPIEIPEVAGYLRLFAQTEGLYFNPGPDTHAHVKIYPAELRVWWGMIGLPVDTTTPPEVWPYPDQHHVAFFTCQMRVSGVVGGTLILGASETIGLEDNILYASSDPINGALAPNHPEKFALVSEGDIKILNTYANGRENSSGMGNAQTDPNLTSIALNGYYFALGNTNANGAVGSFTFENQNDADSGYVFCSGGQPGPDDRGVLYLWGGITQRRRGYVHRSNCNSTGYLKYYRQDPLLTDWVVGVVGDTANVAIPDTLDFGDVLLDSTVWDTVEIHTADYGALALVSAPQPFHALQIPPLYGYHFTVPVSFTPHYATQYSSILQVLASGHLFQIPLYGRGVTALQTSQGAEESSFAFGPTAYPNPFNSSTVFTFSIPTPGHVTLKLYDITGRVAATIFDSNVSSGTQRVPFDARDLPSGLYVARLQTATATTSAKVLLIK